VATSHSQASGAKLPVSSENALRKGTIFESLKRLLSTSDFGPRFPVRDSVKKKKGIAKRIWSPADMLQEATLPAEDPWQLLPLFQV
jgi:hypothetical protein